MNTFTSSIPFRKNWLFSLQLKPFVFGLLLLAAGLSSVIQHWSREAETPTPWPATETVNRPTKPRPVAPDERDVGGSPAPSIRRMPAVVISADRITTEADSEPQPGAVEVIPAAEIVPLAPLGSTAPIRP